MFPVTGQNPRLFSKGVHPSCCYYILLSFFRLPYLTAALPHLVSPLYCLLPKCPIERNGLADFLRIPAFGHPTPLSPASQVQFAIQVLYLPYHLQNTSLRNRRQADETLLSSANPSDAPALSAPFLPISPSDFPLRFRTSILP